jgi:hypothetical protein
MTGPGKRWPSVAGTGWRRWVQRASAAVVAGVAAYASYDHQALFARLHGARGVAAAVWPLSVDGLVVLACVALLDPTVRNGRPWVLVVVRSAFVAGVGMSLVANVAAGATGAAGRWNWAGVAVSGWPPVALLLAVEILMHSLNRDTTDTPTDRAIETTEIARTVNETGTETVPATGTTPGVAGTVSPDLWSGLDSGPGALARPAGTVPEPALERGSMPAPESSDAAEVRAGLAGRRSRGDAHRAMWAHYQAERAAGRTPTGAELDRVAGTRDYGRAVLARWRRTGRIPATEGAEISPIVSASVSAEGPAADTDAGTTVETITPDPSSRVDHPIETNGGVSQAAA